MMSPSLQGCLDWGPDATGSTRAVGLMRIGLSVIALVRFGAELAPFAAETLLALILGLVFFLVATLALIGRNARVSIGLLGAMILGFYGLTQMGIGLQGWNHHHVYILGIACFFLSMSDCGKSYSWDRWQALKEPGGPLPEEGALWGQRLIALQMSALYLWTAIDKTDRAFLSGERLEQTFVWSYSGRALEMLLLFPPLLAAMAVAVVLVEYFLAFAILTKRYRTVAVTLALPLHAVFYLLLPVSTYSATMIILYLAILDPKTVRTITDKMHST
ncbi:MAG: HTTM domain-containing protein [Pseudomonadota bacterium]